MDPAQANSKDDFQLHGVLLMHEQLTRCQQDEPGCVLVLCMVKDATQLPYLGKFGEHQHLERCGVGCLKGVGAQQSWFDG